MCLTLRSLAITFNSLVLRLRMCRKTACYGIFCWKITLSLDDEESFVWREENAVMSVVLTIKKMKKERAELLLWKHYLNSCNKQLIFECFCVSMMRAAGRTIWMTKNCELWLALRILKSNSVLVRTVSDRLVVVHAVDFHWHAFDANLECLLVLVMNAAARTLSDW